MEAGRAGLVVVAAGLLVGRQSGGGADPDRGLRLRLHNNPQLLAQRASLRATDEDVPQALAGWRPTVTLNANAGFNRAGSSSVTTADRQPTPTQFSSFVSRSMELQATQPLYRGGRTEAQTAGDQYRAGGPGADLVGRDRRVPAVATAYLDVVRDQTLVEVARNNEQVLRRQLEATRDRFRVGEVTRTDVAQAESAAGAGHRPADHRRGQPRDQPAAYTRAVGHPPGRLVMPRERPALPATREEALALAAADNPASFPRRLPKPRPVTMSISSAASCCRRFQSSAASAAALPVLHAAKTPAPTPASVVAR